MSHLLNVFHETLSEQILCDVANIDTRFYACDAALWTLVALPEQSVS